MGPEKKKAISVIKRRNAAFMCYRKYIEIIYYIENASQDIFTTGKL